MIGYKLLKLFSIVFVLVPIVIIFAHCPLCTAGAGIGALIAKELGMKSSAIGVWMGAFSVALGWWLGNVVMKRAARFIPRSHPSAEQAGIALGSAFADRLRRNEPRWHAFLLVSLILLSFLSIILPLKLYFYEIGSFSIFWFGDYGSLFNRTYVYDQFLLGSIIGGLMIIISTFISKKIIQLRQNKIFPYQGLIITFILLIIITIFFQFK
ncbi:MAG: hypothetical protein KatS3mg097_636 [Candidatus Parcubacteria bacterium]|nr:MAG: hypothetical protein KatS3mg097_636 [Candidatus Parcubacteria bacterium]